MAEKINWHRYGTKLRHCHPMYNRLACFYKFHLDLLATCNYVQIIKTLVVYFCYVFVFIWMFCIYLSHKSSPPQTLVVLQD